MTRMPDGPEPNRTNPSLATRAFEIKDDDDGAFDLSSKTDSTLSLNQLETDRGTSLPVLGEYLIEGMLGAGGMGQVFRARHRTMDREVALKILPRSMSEDPAAIDRFYAEARATARLMHPNIVTAFDAGCFRVGTIPVHFLVMELIQGDLLSTRIATQGPLSTQEVVHILAQAASALEYAHSQGIIHRDIKPSNMMVTHQNVLKILDFGLAVLRGRHERSQTKSSSQIIGTVEFMAPEQINAPESVDHRCDLYSLGATIFYLLTGRPMFHGEVVQTALAQVHRKPQALYEVRSDVDIRLDSIFQSLVAKNPDERLQSAGELTEKLIKLNLMEKPSISPSRPSTTLPKIATIRPTHFGPESTSQKSFASVGIELGMIHSRISYINRDHRIEEIMVDGDSTRMRNMLFSDGDQIRVGSQAVELRVQKPESIFYGMQRWYGIPLLERPFGGRQVPPEVLVACVIRQMLIATRHELPNASHAVVTVPSCYDQMHRLSTKTACAIAGIELLQLLDKPVAAALAHVEIELRLAKGSSTLAPPKTLLVVMLNGGACEVSLIRVEGLEVRLLATEGDWKRGMVRWHDRAGKKVALDIEKRFSRNAREDRFMASRIQRTLERAFDRLRSSQVVPFLVDVEGEKYENRLDRDRLGDWVDDLVHDCSSFARKVLERTTTNPQDITDILFVGDVRWMAGIRQEIQAIVGDQAKPYDVSSSDLARGASLQADYLMPPISTDAPHAVGSTSYDLGVMMQGDESTVAPPRILIARDHVLPAQISKTLRFTHEGKRQPILQFVEGSRFGASTWNKLGRIDLQNCFVGRQVADPLQLRVDVDESGLWNATVSWPAGNDQIPVAPLNEPLMDIVSIKQWRDWLESLLLCNG